mmetsp:Transcript_55195/g.176897  ORF Transcript_55195/g.176897 Transcript_55195/m.176897 type:complete len:293 (-) Transcript_55195:1066-1944(-)
MHSRGPWLLIPAGSGAARPRRQDGRPRQEAVQENQGEGGPSFMPAGGAGWRGAVGAARGAAGPKAGGRLERRSSNAAPETLKLVHGDGPVVVGVEVFEEVLELMLLVRREVAEPAAQLLELDPPVAVLVQAVEERLDVLPQALGAVHVQVHRGGHPLVEAEGARHVQVEVLEGRHRALLAPALLPEGVEQLVGRYCPGAVAVDAAEDFPLPLQEVARDLAGHEVHQLLRVGAEAGAALHPLHAGLGLLLRHAGARGGLVVGAEPRVHRALHRAGAVPVGLRHHPLHKRLALP